MATPEQKSDFAKRLVLQQRKLLSLATERERREGASEAAASLRAGIMSVSTQLGCLVNFLIEKGLVNEDEVMQALVERGDEAIADQAARMGVALLVSQGDEPSGGLIQ